MLRRLAERASQGNNLSRVESSQALEEILSSDCSDDEITALLIALHQKGETAEELAGFAETMARHAVAVTSNHPVLVDTAGTGGGAETFNISTTAAFLIAAAGVRVAKHGNRAVTSKSGSADVLAALGVDIAAPPETAAQALEEVGFGFFFAPLFHPAMKRVAEIRRELRHRTIFNLLGPLTNPARAAYQIIGVYDADLTPLVGQALAGLGCRKAWVVHSLDGLDELSSGAPSRVTEISSGTLRHFELSPEEWGFGPASIEQYPAGTAEENARLTRGILAGQVSGPCRDVVVLNAAAAIHIATGEELGRAVQRAAGTLESGAALEKLEQLRRFYQSKGEEP